MSKVIVLMSGGVDSSVAAALLQKDGHEVIGVSMRIWNGNRRSGDTVRHACYGPGETKDLEDAEKVAQTLGIPHHVFDLRQAYKNTVLDYVYNEYIRGRTPNPCVVCNQKIKLGTLVENVNDSGIRFDYVATGHYARVGHDGKQGRYLLKKARELRKDQSYFLHCLSQEQLKLMLFPVGEYTKEEIRGIARALGLGIDEKPESQDFFALGHSSLFETASRSGPILNERGETLGKHRGIPFYTIGQRRGLRISADEPLYVTSIDSERNAIIVGTRSDLLDDELVASSLNWVAIKELNETMGAKAKIRHRHTEAKASIDPSDQGRVRVRFEEPQMAITPGQAVVFYDGDIVLGGGTIEQGSERR